MALVDAVCRDGDIFYRKIFARGVVVKNLIFMYEKASRAVSAARL